MHTMRWRGVAVAVAVGFSLTTASLGQANLQLNGTNSPGPGLGGQEIKSTPLDVAITQYGWIDLGTGDTISITSITETELGGAGAPGGTATKLTGALTLLTEANTPTTFSVPTTMMLSGGPGPQTLTADCDLVRWDQGTSPFPPSPPLASSVASSSVGTGVGYAGSPSGSNEYDLELEIDPAAHSNTSTGVWDVLLQAGDYSGTVLLTLSATTSFSP